MKRPAMPVVTSPWKIGFLVSLTLVAVSSGVAYFFITRSEFAGAMPRLTEWQTILESLTPPHGAAIEYWPLLAVVGFSSLLSYLVITRAVSKYKAFLDSGHDYRNLLTSIREIDDLEDKSRIERLRNHPELRDFLLGIRESAAARMKKMDKREESLERRESAGNVDEEFRERLAFECDRLVGAVQSAVDSQFPRSVELALPELQGLEQVLRTAFETMASQGEAGQPVSSGGAQLNGDVGEIVRMVEEGLGAVRELERELADATMGPSTETAAVRKEIEALVVSVETVRRLAATMEAMDEETKSVAINTALTAGASEGSQSELVEFAEGVNDIAAKFGEASRSCLGAAEDISRNIGAIEAALNRFLDSMDANSHNSDAINTTAGKLSRCVENLAVVLEKVKAAAETPAAVEMDIAPPVSEEPESPLGEFEFTDAGFEAIDRTRPILGDEQPNGSELGGIETPSEPEFAGIEVQPERIISEPAADGDDFADLSGNAAAAENGIDHDEAPQMPAVEPTTPQMEGIHKSGGGFDLESNVVDLPGEDQAAYRPAVSVEVDEDAFDLYELGAVDYDPALHN